MMDRFMKFLLFTVPVFIWFLAMDFLMTRYANSIDVDKINAKAHLNKLESATKVPPSPKPLSASPTKYIVTGGAGFLGSWIARFLLFRGATNITILDNNPRAPPDLVKHGVKYVNVDLTDKEAFEKELKNILGDAGGFNAVIFHAAAIQRHYIGYRSFDKEPAHQNVTMAENIVDLLNDVANKLKTRSVKSTITLINVGDTEGDYEPPSWWKLWTFSSWANTRNTTRGLSRSYLSSYAEAKVEAESVLLSAESFVKTENTDIYVTSLRVHGFITGYYGEPVFSPALFYGAIIDHCWSVPTSFIHVEDVCRAALLAENAIATSAASRGEVIGKSFVVSNGQVVRFGDGMKQLMNMDALRDIRVNPALVLLCSYIVVHLVAPLVPGVRTKWQSRDTSIFSGRWWVLTPERFNTVQTVQLPAHDEVAKTRRAIGFLASHSAEDALVSQGVDFGHHKAQIRKSAEEGKKKKKKT